MAFCTVYRFLDSTNETFKINKRYQYILHEQMSRTILIISRILPVWYRVRCWTLSANLSQWLMSPKVNKYTGSQILGLQNTRS